MLYAKMSNSELGIAPRFTFWNLASVLTIGEVGFDGLVLPAFPPPFPFDPPGLLGAIGATGVVGFLPIILSLISLIPSVQLTIANNDITNNINFLFFFMTLHLLLKKKRLKFNF